MVFGGCKAKGSRGAGGNDSGLALCYISLRVRDKRNHALRHPARHFLDATDLRGERACLEIGLRIRCGNHLSSCEGIGDKGASSLWKNLSRQAEMHASFC